MGGYDHYEEVRVLNDPQSGSGFIVHADSASQEDFAYSMDTMTYSDYQPTGSFSSRGAEYQTPQSPLPIPPNHGDDPMVSTVQSPVARPFSPPVFEYHFEYPTAPPQ